MNTIVDTLGRTLHLTTDHEHKRVILSSSTELGANSIIASFTVEQSLDFAAMLVAHVAPLRSPDADHHN